MKTTQFLVQSRALSVILIALVLLTPVSALANQNGYDNGRMPLAFLGDCGDRGMLECLRERAREQVLEARQRQRPLLKEVSECLEENEDGERQLCLQTVIRSYFTDLDRAPRSSFLSISECRTTDEPPERRECIMDKIQDYLDGRGHTTPRRSPRLSISNCLTGDSVQEIRICIIGEIRDYVEELRR